MVLLLPLGAALVSAQEPNQPRAGQQTSGSETPAEEFARLRRQLGDAQRQAIKAYQDEVAKIEAADQRAGTKTPVPEFSMRAVTDRFLAQFRAAAERHRGSDAALPFLQWLLAYEQGAEKQQVVATLMREHEKSPTFGDAAAAIGYQARELGVERVRELLTEIIAANEFPDVAAQALLSRAELVLDQEEEPAPEQQAAALADLRRAVQLATDAQLAAKAEGVLFEREHLQPGMPAPEIEGTDLLGEPMKLSDHRGNVVLLDFWGDW